MSDAGERKARRRCDYRPSVERLEALRLLNAATHAHAIEGLGIAAEHGSQTDVETSLTALLHQSQAVHISDAASDAVLTQNELSDLLAPVTSGTTSPTTDIDLEAVSAGLNQMNRYLSRAWYRAAIPAQLHDDCSQAVFTKLLQDLGRPRFEDMLGDIGHSGVKDVFTKETAEGADFFLRRRHDQKARQRERTYQSLDMAQSVAAPHDDSTASQRHALREAIHTSLNPREAELIHDTLMGKTPAEIAQQWGVAPKTVSNEKIAFFRSSARFWSLRIRTNRSWFDQPWVTSAVGSLTAGRGLTSRLPAAMSSITDQKSVADISSGMKCRS